MVTWSSKYVDSTMLEHSRNYIVENSVLIWRNLKVSSVVIAFGLFYAPIGSNPTTLHTTAKSDATEYNICHIQKRSIRSRKGRHLPVPELGAAFSKPGLAWSGFLPLTRVSLGSWWEERIPFVEGFKRLLRLELCPT